MAGGTGGRPQEEDVSATAGAVRLKVYLGYRPSKKSIRRVEIQALTARSGSWQDATELVAKLNRTLRGWVNYFEVGTVTKVYRAIDNYITLRLRRWLRFKHKVRRRKGGTYYACAALGTTSRG